MAALFHTSDRQHSRKRAFSLSLAVLLVIVLLVAAACSNRQPLGNSPDTSAATTNTSTPTVTSTPAPPAPTSAETPTAAIKATIQKANDEQVAALSQHDATLMRDTATSSYYALMEQTQQDMERGGVAEIKLLQLQWGPITVQGSTAQAATTENWQVTFTDGTTQQSIDRNVYVLVQQSGTWLIDSDTQVGSRSVTPPGSRTPGSGAPGSPGTTTPNQSGGSPSTQSSNWSGYVASGGPFTSVTSTWTISQVSPTSRPGSADAAWIGIGGANSNDLIQAGTMATVSASGDVAYSAWVETLPQAAHAVDLAVQPGDVVTVSVVQQTPGNWLVSIENKTTGQSYQSPIQYASSLSSVEWIEEAPSTASGRSRVVALDNFGQVQFQAASATLNGQKVSIAQAGGQAITMFDQSGQIAVPSALSNGGTSFTVTRVTAGE